MDCGTPRRKFGGSGNYRHPLPNWDLGLTGLYELGNCPPSITLCDPVTGQITYPSSNPNTQGVPACPANGLFCRPAMPGVTVLQLKPSRCSNPTAPSPISSTRQREFRGRLRLL